MNPSSVLSAILMTHTITKRTPLMITLSLGGKMEHEQVNRKVVPVLRCSSRPGTSGGLGRSKQVHYCDEVYISTPFHTLRICR